MDVRTCALESTLADLSSFRSVSIHGIALASQNPWTFFFLFFSLFFLLGIVIGE